MSEFNRLKFKLSEKSADAIKDNKYIFIVSKNLNKIYLKQYFKQKYSVDVTDVHTMNYKGKTRRRGRVSGSEADYKKVILTLKEGQEIKEFKQLF